MNKSERLALIEKTRAEAAAMVVELAERRAFNETHGFDDDWKAPVRKSMKSDVIYKTREAEAPPQLSPEASPLVDEVFLHDVLMRTVDVIAQEVTVVERKLVERDSEQAAQITDIGVQLTLLRGEIAELRSQIIDGERSASSVVKLLRGSV